MGEGGLGWKVFRMSAWIRSIIIWSACDNAHFLDFPLAASTARTLGLDTNSLAVMCLSLPVITFNTWKKQVFDMPKKKKVSLNKLRINQ